MNFTRVSSSSSLFYNRSLTERVLWSTLFSLEGFLILVCNTLALTVFLQPSFLSKKSTYFLISLTVADLLTGATVALAVKSISGINNEKELTFQEMIQLWFDIFAGCASIYSLTAIAAERFYAIFRPFKQRRTKARTYKLWIGGVWLMSLLIPSATIFYSVGFPNDETMQLTMGYLMMILGLSCLAAIALSYFCIWLKITCCKKEIQPNPVHANRYNKKLTTTMILVTFVSLATWVPNFVIFVAQVVCPECLPSLFPRQYYAIAQFLIYSNSFANFIIYTYRMKEFRSEMAKVICKCKVAMNFCLNFQRNVTPEFTSAVVMETRSTEPATLIGMKALHSE